MTVLEALEKTTQSIKAYIKTYSAPKTGWDANKSLGTDEDGRIVEKDVILTVKDFDTVADMVASDIPVVGLTVQTLGFYEVNDGGGALYKIYEAGSHTANGANIIKLNNGLVAVLISDIANIKQYGGKASAGFDNTAVFNAAFASDKEVFIPHGLYGLFGKVTVEEKHSARKIRGEEMGDDGSVLWMGKDAYFDVKAQSVYFNGITFYNNNYQTKDDDPNVNPNKWTANNGYHAIISNPPNGLDGDVYVENCQFSYIQFPVTTNGRGLQVHNSSFVHCNNPCTYNYIGKTDGDVEDSDPTTDIVTGGRGLAVTDCRFHSLNSDGASINIVKNSVVFNPLITGNQMDTGQGNFLRCDGDIYGGVIDGNVIGLLTTYAFLFNGKIENVTISNNAVMNYNMKHGTGLPLSFIRVAATSCDGFSVLNNSFFGCSGWSIVFTSTDTTSFVARNCKVVGNTFDTVGTNNTSACAPVLFNGTHAENIVISNNIVKNTPSGVTYFVMGSQNKADLSYYYVTNSIISDNSLPPTMGPAHLTTVPRNKNIIQNDDVIFNTVDDMVNSTVLIVSSTAQTLGFHKVNDGGAATYAISKIVEPIPVDPENPDGPKKPLNAFEVWESMINGASAIQLSNGLVAVLVADVANVKQYGAYCDMKNDDSVAFNHACASGKDVFIPNGNYLLKNIVNVATTGSRKIYSDAKGASGAVLYMADGAYFYVTEQSTWFDSVRFINYPAYVPPKEGEDRKPDPDYMINGQRAILADDVGVNTETGEPEYDADLWVENCQFMQFEFPIHVKDRGCQVTNTQFVSCGDNITYEFVGGGDTNTPITDSILGGRGFAVKGCRFHANDYRRAAIRIKAGSTVFNPMIADNQMDAGYGHFIDCDGDIYGGVISGNIVNFATTNTIEFSGIVDNCMVVNNSFQNWEDRWPANNIPTQIIRCDGSKVTGLAIRGNTFRGTSHYGVVLTATSQENIQIAENVFDSIGSTAESHCPIHFNTPCSKILICNNIVRNAPDVCIYFVRSNSYSIPMTKSVILGNVLPDHVKPVWTNCVPAESNTIQNY